MAMAQPNKRHKEKYVFVAPSRCRWQTVVGNSKGWMPGRASRTVFGRAAGLRWVIGSGGQLVKLNIQHLDVMMVLRHEGLQHSSLSMWSWLCRSARLVECSVDVMAGLSIQGAEAKDGMGR